MNADLGPSEGSGAPAASSEEEAMFLAEQREAGTGEASRAMAPAKVAEIEDEKGDLPPMDDLIKRIPLAARDTLEELFRARFVTVKRIPKSALKN